MASLLRGRGRPTASLSDDLCPGAKRSIALTERAVNCRLMVGVKRQEPYTSNERRKDSVED